MHQYMCTHIYLFHEMKKKYKVVILIKNQINIQKTVITYNIMARDPEMEEGRSEVETSLMGFFP